MRAIRNAYLSLAGVVAVSAQAHAAAPERGDIEVGEGVHIHYVAAGDGRAGRTLLLIPGWSMSSAVWREQMARFSLRHRVIALDPRSQGDSTITVRGNTPEQRARDTQRVIQALDLSDVVLIGWSQGVQDVAAYAAQFGGEHIAGYVLVDAPVASGTAAWLDRPDALRQQLDRLVLYQEHQSDYLRGMLSAIIQSDEGRKHIEEYAAIGARTPPDLGIAMLMMDFIAYDRRAALKKFNRPTLVIAAQSSNELDAQRRTAAAIERAQFETVANAGHAVFVDQPQRFFDLVDGFIRKL